MKKAIVIVLVSLLAAAVLLTGCGGEEPATSGGGAEKILRVSMKKMEGVNSFKAEGYYNLVSQGQTMKSDFSMEIENPKNPEGRMVMKVGGQDMDVYFSGGYVYMEDPQQGWVKYPAGESQQFSQTSPEELKKFAENAKNLRVVVEDADSVEVAFEVDRKLLEELMKGSADTSDLGAEYQKMMDQIIKKMKMDVVFDISKDTDYIESARVKMSMSDVPMVGDMKMEIKIDYSDYNSDVTVSLPAEAQSAKEITEPAGTTMPGFPGLGL